MEVTGNDQGALNYLGEHDFSFPFLKGTYEMFAEDYNVFAAPVWYLVDRSGKIAYRHVGYVQGDENILENEVNSLLTID